GRDPDEHPLSSRGDDHAERGPEGVRGKRAGPHRPGGVLPDHRRGDLAGPGPGEARGAQGETSIARGRGGGKMIAERREPEGEARRAGRCGRGWSPRKPGITLPGLPRTPAPATPICLEQQVICTGTRESGEVGRGVPGGAAGGVRGKQRAGTAT